MKRYAVNAVLVCGQYLGEVEAESAEEAIDKLGKKAGATLCYHCSRKISDLELDDITADEVEGTE